MGSDLCFPPGPAGAADEKEQGQDRRVCSYDRTNHRRVVCPPARGHRAGRESSVNVCVPNAEGLPADTGL